MENQGLPMAAADNLLDLLQDAQGRIPLLTIRELEGNERDTRLTQCIDFCRFLNGQDCFIRAFNHLPHHQQIIAVLIQENSDEHPHRVKEHYL